MTKSILLAIIFAAGCARPTIQVPVEKEAELPSGGEVFVEMEEEQPRPIAEFVGYGTLNTSKDASESAAGLGYGLRWGMENAARLAESYVNHYGTGIIEYVVTEKRMIRNDHGGGFYSYSDPDKIIGTVEISANAIGSDDLK